MDTPSMEGMLEKHSTGVSRFLGKTRFWCTLQGSCLVYCKESKRSSVVESLLLGDAQMVRKTQGSQFEVVMKKQKTHLFTAASPEECSLWVKCLQQAMIQHAPSQTRSPLRRQVNSDHGYEEISIADDNTTCIVSIPQSGIYADVADAVKVKLKNDSVGDYAEVDDFLRISRKPSEEKADSVVIRENSLYTRNKEKEAKEAEAAAISVENDFANGYSTLDSCRDMAMKKEIKSKEEKDDEMYAKESATIPEYAKVNKTKKASQRITPPSSQMPVLEEDQIYQNTSDVGERIDENQVYENTIEVKEGAAIENLDRELKRLPVSYTTPSWILLTADDRQPLEDLKEFLSNNRRLCRPSFTPLSDQHDPILKLKELIQEIG